jgi:hypothetical protein
MFNSQRYIQRGPRSVNSGVLLYIFHLLHYVSPHGRTFTFSPATGAGPVPGAPRRSASPAFVMGADANAPVSAHHRLMKRWAILVVALYFLILAATEPVIALAVLKNTTVKDVAAAYLEWRFWAWLLVMVLGQAALLAVPVRFASRRPVTRGPLLPTVLASGLMMGALGAGAVCAIYEFATGGIDMSDWDGWCALGVMLLTWCLWSLIFFRMGRKEGGDDFITRQSRVLLRGSILELLIAVPTHIAARQRDYCCAGFLTFVGLTMGFSVMLFSFGPAVFFLFVARWRRLHPDRF